MVLKQALVPIGNHCNMQRLCALTPGPCMCAQVSDRDDRLLTEQMLALETANQEVAGDDDSEEEEVGMGELDVDAPAPLPA